MFVAGVGSIPRGDGFIELFRIFRRQNLREQGVESYKDFVERKWAGWDIWHKERGPMRERVADIPHV